MIENYIITQSHVRLRDFKGRFRATIFESAETVYLILLCYFGVAIRRFVPAEKKMVALNRPLCDLYNFITLNNATFHESESVEPFSTVHYDMQDGATYRKKKF